ncbi:MAG: ubiquinol-cytochrome c reductase iron-sulfur subunit [Fuerstiella sp.]
MSDQKPSSDDILSKIRGAAKPAGDKPAAAEESSAAAAPKGTSDILASIKGGAAKPKAAAPAGTADIMASIKGGAAAKPAAPAGTAGILDSIKGGGAAKPAGTASILDSIKGGGAAKPAAASVAPKAAAKAAVDPSKASGMSAADMIKAARTSVGGSVEATAVPKKVALPSKPLVQPAAAAKAADTRRSFLSDALTAVCSPLFVAWGSLITATAASSLAMARFMMPNVLVEPPTKFKIGPPTDYGASTVSTKWKAQFGVWIVNDEIDGQQMIYALSTVCTHLGCTPNWLEGEQKFKCPCHGSGFYKSGVNFEGPAPRPLERHGIRLAEDGTLEVDKSVKFQKELGQWDNAACFVPV